MGFSETFWITVGVVIELTIWAASASIAWFAGMRVLRRPATDASWDEVARGLAYANAPRLLLPLIPLVQYAPGGTPDNPAAWAGDAFLIAWAAVAVWVLAAWAASLRVALGFGAGRAAVTAVLAWLPPAAFATLAVRHALAGDRRVAVARKALRRARGARARGGGAW